MQKQLLLAGLLVILAPAYLKAQKKSADSLRPTSSAGLPPLQYGIASFYDNKFEGRQTSNGEIFTQKKMTAASNTLPQDR